MAPSQIYILTEVKTLNLIKHLERCENCSCSPFFEGSVPFTVSEQQQTSQRRWDGDSSIKCHHHIWESL